MDVELFPDQFGRLDIDSLIARHEYPIDWYAASADDLAAGVGLAWSPLIGNPPDCRACSFRQEWLLPGGGVDRPEQLALEPTGTPTPRTQARRRLEVRPRRGPSSSLRPNGVVLSAPSRRLWQVEFDKEASDLAIEFDDRFTDPGPGAQLGVWLDDRQVLTTAADWSGATGNHAVVDVSSLDVGRHTLTAVLTPPARGRSASVILGGFLMQSQPGVTSPGRPLSADAKLALLALALFAIVGMLAWLLRRGERHQQIAPSP